MTTRTAVLIARWVARVWSIASIGTLLLFFIGEGLLGEEEFTLANITPAEWLGLVLFPGSISVGMLLAWWREGLGGAITVGSLLAFYIFDLLTTGTFPSGLAFALFSMPGVIFLGCWLLSQHNRNSRPGEHPGNQQNEG
jgi:hypothetical protein